MNGWDFFIELRPEQMPFLDADSQPAAIKALIQVKSTDDFSNRRLNLTVSNMLHLARAIMPTFIFVVDYRGNEKPQACFLCHIDEARIGQTLRRTREIDVSGDEKFNKHWISFEAKEFELVHSTIGDWLKKEIFRLIGHDMAAYTKQKSDWLARVGYEQGRFQFTIHDGVLITDLVNAQLGLQSLKISNATVHTLRFGITKPMERIAAGELTISANPIGPCRIVASSKTANRRVEFPGSVIVPGIPGLPSEYFKARVTSEFCEIILEHGTVSFKASLNSEDRIPFEELKNRLTFLHIASRDDAIVDLFRGNDRFARIRCDRVNNENEHFGAALVRAEYLESFMIASSLDRAISISCQDLFNQTEFFRWMELFLGKAKEISCDLEQAVPKKMQKVGMFATALVFSYEDRHVVGFCTWKAKFFISEARLRVKVRPGELWNYIEVDDISSQNIASMYGEFRDYCQKISKGTLMIRDLETSGNEADNLA